MVRAVKEDSGSDADHREGVNRDVEWYLAAMHDLAADRATYTGALETAAERLRSVLATIPEIRRVVLFGSFATGRRDLFTDLDVLVEMESSLDFVSRTARLHERLHLDVDIDLFVYTPSELAHMAESGFIQRALSEGKVIYERDAAGGGTALARAGGSGPRLG